MRGQKAKIIRARAFGAAKEQGWPERHLVYKDTRRVSGWRTPAGWDRKAFAMLMTTGGPWAEEAKKHLVVEYKRVALNHPHSGRALYRAAKKAFR